MYYSLNVCILESIIVGHCCPTDRGFTFQKEAVGIRGRKAKIYIKILMENRKNVKLIPIQCSQKMVYAKK